MFWFFIYIYFFYSVEASLGSVAKLKLLYLQSHIDQKISFIRTRNTFSIKLQTYVCVCVCVCARVRACVCLRMCNPPGSAPTHRAGREPGTPVREAGALPRRLKATASNVSR